VALLLDEAAEVALAAMPLPAEGEVLLIVGPEGGITPEEAGEFVAAGARPARMGPTILRTSTAGTAAASVVLSATGRWG